MALLLGLVFGAIGSGYLIYGKRQANVPFLVAGVLLVVYPYFVSSVLVSLVLGAVLVAAPFVAERV